MKYASLVTRFLRLRSASTQIAALHMDSYVLIDFIKLYYILKSITFKINKIYPFYGLEAIDLYMSINFVLQREVVIILLVDVSALPLHLHLLVFLLRYLHCILLNKSVHFSVSHVYKWYFYSPCECEYCFNAPNRLHLLFSLTIFFKFISRINTVFFPFSRVVSQTFLPLLTWV